MTHLAFRDFCETILHLKDVVFNLYDRNHIDEDDYHKLIAFLSAYYMCIQEKYSWSIDRRCEEIKEKLNNVNNS